MTMTKKLYDKKQQEIIDAFFKEFRTWDVGDIGYKIVAGFFIFFQLIFMAFPYQSGEYKEMGILGIFPFIGYANYTMSYTRFTEKGVISSIYKKIKYMPISLTQLKIYRIKKLAAFSLKVTAATLVVQLLFAFGIYHEITLANILYPLLFSFVIPFGLYGIILWISA